MDWGAIRELRGDLIVGAITADGGGSSGNRPRYAPWPAEEDVAEDSAPKEAFEPEATVDINDTVSLTADPAPETPNAVDRIRNLPPILRLIALDFHLQWASLLAAASRPSVSTLSWKPRARDLEKALHATRNLPLSPCEAVVNRIIRG